VKAGLLITTIAVNVRDEESINAVCLQLYLTATKLGNDWSFVGAILKCDLFKSRRLNRFHFRTKPCACRCMSVLPDWKKNRMSETLEWRERLEGAHKQMQDISGRGASSNAMQSVKALLNLTLDSPSTILRCCAASG
jgi:hypothetical protein